MRAYLVSLSTRIFPIVLGLAAFAGTAISQARPEDPAVIANKCLSSPPTTGPNDSDVIAVPIDKLFMDGRTRTVSELLCIVRGMEGEIDWFWVNRATRGLTKTYRSYEVSEVPTPSPNGKYLAVTQYAEGRQWIDVVSLPSLMRDGKYESIDLIGSYPGSVSIKEWKGEELIVTSDMLLSAGRGLELFSTGEESFSVNLQTGAIVALSPSLRDPVRYYCEQLADVYSQTLTDENDHRLFIAMALGNLGQKAGMPCLERALAMETDKTIRSDLQASIKELAETIALQTGCLAGSAEDLKGKGIVRTPLTTLFMNGQSRAIDILLCAAQRTWLQFDRSVPDPVGEFLEGGGVDTDVELMRASPDGRYLAVEYRERYVDVVDLTSLLTTRRYKSIQILGGSFKEWNGANLEVTSDTLLSHLPIRMGDKSHVLPLLSKESFVWDSGRRTVTPKWSALENPLRYYCEGLTVPEIGKRRISAQGLRLLNDRDAASCIRTALVSESDESLKRELRDLLSKFQEP